MFIKHASNRKNLIKVKKNYFFLKFLEQKNFIKTKQDKRTHDLDFVDIKKLLDERNVKITLKDIYSDYKYFKREYYYYHPNDYAENIQTFKQKKEDFPLKKDQLTVKNLFYYYFIKDPMTSSYFKIIFVVSIFLNIFAFILKYKHKRIERINLQTLKQMDKNKEQITEKEHHQRKKWT